MEGPADLTWDATPRPLVELRTPRLLLRQWRDADVAAFTRMNADPRVMAHFERTQTPEESAASAARVRADLEQRGWGLWAVERPSGGGFLGFTGLQPVPDGLPFSPALEVGWRLAPEVWGRGYAPEAAREALRFAFEELAADEVVAMTSVRNANSRRVMDKLGMAHDPADDFEHPRVPVGHSERACVLYRLPARRWRAQAR